MDVREPARVEEIEQPRGNRRSEILVEWRHGTGLDITAKTRPHHVFVSASKAFDKCFEIAKVVRAIRVTHKDVFATDVRKRIDVCASKAAPGTLEHTSTPGKSDFGRFVRGAVDDQHLAPDVCLSEAFHAPVHKHRDCDLLIKSGNNDRKLRVLDIVFRNSQQQVRILHSPFGVRVSNSQRSDVHAAYNLYPERDASL